MASPDDDLLARDMYPESEEEDTVIVNRDLPEDHTVVVRRASAEDEDHTVVVRRASAEDEDHTVVVRRASAEDDDHTVAVRRTPAEDATRVVIRTQADDDRTRVRQRGPARSAGRQEPAASNGALVPPGRPSDYRPPQVESGASVAYGVRALPRQQPLAPRHPEAPAAYVTLPGTAEEIRRAAAVRLRRRRRTLFLVIVLVTVSVAALAVVAVILIAGL